jgi:hypothetical protein
MRRSVVAIVLLVSALLLGGCFLQSWLTTTNVPEVERKVDSALPVGSTRQEIEAWLAGEGIEFSFSNEPGSFSPLVARVPDAGSYPGVIAGIIRDTDRSFLVSGSIQLYFLLGPDGRLSRRVVRWVGTGP